MKRGYGSRQRWTLRSKKAAHSALTTPHFRHHLTHRKEADYKGQRAPEDYEFYKELVKALENAPSAVVIGDATGKSSAMHFFRDYLAEHHKALLQRVAGFVDADLSALTEPQIREIAARYWH
jgi:stalled ribosome rescue protein Dom34